jgi:hypothetical protein
MLAALRVAAGGSAPPIPSAARQGSGTARSGRESRPACRTGKQGLGQGCLDDIATHRLRLGGAIREASRFASVKDGRNIASSCPRFPRLPVTDDRVEDCQQPPHAGGQGDFGWTTSLAQAQIHPADDRIDASGNQRSHVERRAHRSAATANSPASPHCAAVAVHRRHPHQSSEPPTVEGSEFQGARPRGSGQRCFRFLGRNREVPGQRPRQDFL